MTDRRSRWLVWLVVGVLPCVTAGAADQVGAAGRVGFNADVRPILSDRCFACHGPNASSREADLRLDQRQSAVADRGGYRAIWPGDVGKSELLRRVASADPDEVMPPPGKGEPLSAEEIAILRRWIASGARYEKHWSYAPLKRPAVPSAGFAEPRHAVDAFIDRKLREGRMTPNPPADPRTLVRRLAFDLTGLPPQPEVVESFVRDPSDAAYVRLVDHFLASPHYGERMAMYWLDLVRYADSLGYHGDQERSVSPYRDYVIRAFNDNMPFDRFTVEQLAGDLLPGATLWQRVASTYNRLNRASAEGGVQPKEYLAKYAADRVRTTGSVWLGSTFACGECHDHKFDPFTMRDFYRFAAFFADIREQGIVAGAKHVAVLRVPTAEQAARRRELARRLAAIETDCLFSDGPWKSDKFKSLERLLDRYTPQLEPMRVARREVRSAIEELDASIVTTLATSATHPRTMRVLPRGNWMDESGEVVVPGVPAFLPQPSSGTEHRLTRLDLARWLTSRDNPLVARTFVNRLWMLLFGEGICRTVDDIGSQGEAPTHPELLDWLAVEFIDSGWDVKHMVRLIVLSDAYRRSSRTTAALMEADPYNKMLARQGRWRLDAEMIRDQALAVSGLLVRTIGGVSIRPYQPAGYWAQLNFPKRVYRHDRGPAQYRRGVYVHWQRTFLHPSLLAFDAPVREECTARRARSNTPLQALVLLNDPTYVESARVLAARVMREGDRSFDSRLRFLWRTVLARRPTASERERLATYFKRNLKVYRDAPQEAKRLTTVGLAKTADLDAAQLAAWTAVCRIVLNLHETITRY